MHMASYIEHMHIINNCTQACMQLRLVPWIHRIIYVVTVVEYTTKGHLLYSIMHSY